MQGADARLTRYEQAIGRVRRWGQPRSEVHVWRFVAGGTIEEAMARD